MKKILSIILCALLLPTITGCGKNKLGGDEPYKVDYNNVLFSINTVNQSCIPVNLTIYKDGKYELFTTYKGCRPGTNCTSELVYTKSLKGTYDYDVMKIIDNSTNADNLSFTMDKLPEYEIYMGQSYVENGYAYEYVIENGKTNKYLNEFLKQINIELNTCAEVEYK